MDKKLSEKEERARQRKLKEEKKRHEQMRFRSLQSSRTTPDFIEMQATSQTVSSEITIKRGRKDFVTPKLVAALDRCQLSIRDSVYILQAVVEGLGLSCDDFPIKPDFHNRMPEMETFHWDGKLLPGLDVRSSKKERLF